MPDIDRSQSAVSPLSQNNFILLCIAFLMMVSIFLIENLTSIAILVAATILLGYLLIGPIHLIEHFLNKIQKQGTPLLPHPLQRTIAIILVYMVFIGAVGLVLLRLAPPLIFQLKSMAHDLPQYMQRFQSNTTTTTTAKWTVPGVQQQVVSATSSHFNQRLAELYGQYASKLGSYLLDFGTSALSGLIYGLTTMVLVFILLQDGAHIRRGIVELMPDRIQPKCEQFLKKLHHHAYSYIKAQALMCLLAGTMMYLLLTLLDSPYSLLLSVFFGAVSILPVVGPWIGLITLLGFISYGLHPENMMPVLLYLIIFYLLKIYWLWPKLLPKNVNMHPVIFLVLFLACYRLAGIWGVLLAFPLTSIFGVLLDYLQEQAKRTNI